MANEKGKEMNECIKEIAKDFIKGEFSSSMCKLIQKGKAELKDVINYVIKTKAWKDATIRDRFNKNSDIRKSKETITDYVVKCVNELGTNTFQYRTWHTKVMKQLKLNYGMNIGMSQKLINMAIKYLYFLEIGYDFKCFSDFSLLNFQNEFDVPIDSYILKWVLLCSVNDTKINKDGGVKCAWTELDDMEVYKLLQEKAKQLLKKAFPTYPAIVAESVTWNYIKIII